MAMARRVAPFVAPEYFSGVLTMLIGLLCRPDWKFSRPADLVTDQPKQRWHDHAAHHNGIDQHPKAHVHPSGPSTTSGIPPKPAKTAAKPFPAEVLLERMGAKALAIATVVRGSNASRRARCVKKIV